MAPNRPDVPPPVVAAGRTRTSSAVAPVAAGGRRRRAGGGWACLVAVQLRRRANPEAARLVEEARIALRAGTPVKDREAIALIERAVAIAPDDAAAWGLLALVRARTDQHAAPDAAVSATALIDEAAERALALDPANADARAALALAIPYYGDWLAAERRFDAVLADHPDHVITQDSRTFLLGAVGRMRESGLARYAVAPNAPLRCQRAIPALSMDSGFWVASRRQTALPAGQWRCGPGITACGSRGSGCWPERNRYDTGTGSDR